MKKNVFFWALPKLPNPPPLTPIRATWSFFFGGQNSRFESHLWGALLEKGPKIQAWVDPPPLIWAMPERKRFFY